MGAGEVIEVKSSFFFPTHLYPVLWYSHLASGSDHQSDFQSAEVSWKCDSHPAQFLNTSRFEIGGFQTKVT